MRLPSGERSVSQGRIQSATHELTQKYRCGLRNRNSCLGVGHVDQKNHFKAPMFTNTIDVENLKRPPEGEKEARRRGESHVHEQHRFTSSEREEAFYVASKCLSHRLKHPLTGYLALWFYGSGKGCLQHLTPYRALLLKGASSERRGRSYHPHSWMED